MKRGQSNGGYHLFITYEEMHNRRHCRTYYVGGRLHDGRSVTGLLPSAICRGRHLPSAEPGRHRLPGVPGQRQYRRAEMPALPGARYSQVKWHATLMIPEPISKSKYECENISNLSDCRSCIDFHLTSSVMWKIRQGKGYG